MSRVRLAGPAAAVALALAALAIAANGGVKGFSAVPDVVRGAAALLALVTISGYAPARLLVPRSMWPHLHLVVPLVGCATSGLALTALGFAQVPLDVSVAIVLGAGLVAAIGTRRRLGPARPTAAEIQDEEGRTYTTLWPLYIGLVVAAILLVPIFQEGYATVPGSNPDAMMAVGSAEFLQHTAPGDLDPALPVDRMPRLWRSKYPIYYVLAGSSTLSGLDPIESFAAVAATLAALAAAGFLLLARHGLGAGPRTAVLVMGVVALARSVGYLAIHPYFNQLWGLLALPLIFLFGLRFIADPNRRDAVLLGLFTALGVAAYPLMVLFPALVLAGAAITVRRAGGLRIERGTRTPATWRGRVMVALLAVVALPAALVLLLGVAEKTGSAADLLLSGESLAEWRGDLTSYLEPGFFVGATGIAGYVAAAAALAAAVAGLRHVPRPAARGLAAAFAGAIAFAVYFGLREFGEYFHFKLLAFLAPLVLTAAAVWVGRAVAFGGRRAAVAAAATAAFVAFQLVGLRDEVVNTGRQVDRSRFELRDAARALPHNASIRLDLAPDGHHLWAAYMLSEHPLSTLTPLVGTTYPSVPTGRKADYIVADAKVELDPWPDSAGAPLFENERFRIYRMRRGVPGPDLSSRRMVEQLGADLE